MATMGGGVLAALVVGGIIALVPDDRSLSHPVDRAVAQSVVAPSPTRDTARKTAREFAPRLPLGRTSLGDGMFAQRTDSGVSVHFDTELLRTRYDWKFEGVVRATLPMIYGDDARTALERVPQGQLVRDGRLLIELPKRGFDIPLPTAGRTLTVYPVTRPGEDGPLVVAYRVIPR